MKLEAYSISSNSCIGSKRIYVCNGFLTWVCPKCQQECAVGSNKDEVWVSYGHCCLHFYCDHCRHEPAEAMYTLNEIGEDYIDITLSDKYDLKCFEIKTVYEELKENK